MEAKDYLKKIGITDRVLNREDLPEYWKSISQLMEEFAALCQPPVSGRVCFSSDCFYNDKTLNICVGDYDKCTVKQTHR
jgi:hypothetical protein